MTARLSALAPGTRFRCLGIEGELVKLSPGAAVVELDTRSHRRFVARDGESPREVEFLSGGRRQTWALGTEVEVLP